MRFFKKLKERLFTLNVDKKPQEKILNNSNLKTKEIATSKSDDNPLVDKKVQLTKKIEKEKIKERKKQHKLNKYIAGLNKSNVSFSRAIKELQSRHNQIDENFFEELETALIMADISHNLVTNIIDEIKREVKLENVQDIKLIGEIIADKIFTIYTNQSIVDTELNIKRGNKNVILVVGVNGSGKTTTIGKIGAKLKNDKFKVLIAAADTFRAGAVEQLKIWSDKIGVRLVKSNKENVDPASVVYDALQILKNEDYDVLIIDTAGRLQNKVNLMNELQKIYQIVKKQLPDAPQESLLVLDATTGQNGISQAKHFKEITNLTGIILTKMDGTSKGGIILTIKDELQLAVKYLGLGEKLDDLEEFDLDAFIYSMTSGLEHER